MMFHLPSIMAAVAQARGCGDVMPLRDKASRAAAAAAFAAMHSGSVAPAVVNVSATCV